jgi:hypothetical protein
MTLFRHTYTQAYSTSFVYYYTNIIIYTQAYSTSFVYYYTNIIIYTQAYSTSFVYRYTNIITLVCIQTVKKTVKWSLPMTCDVFVFQ